MHGLATNPVGRVILAAVPSLVFWHAAHHLRHFALDLGLGGIHAQVAYVLYGLAALGTIASVAAVAAL
jgi:fumarate reductase subunit D